MADAENADRPRFAHLHNHSQLSLLDGESDFESMAARAEEIGLSALALTDHGRMAGLVGFYEACQRHNVKPIMGIEAYCTGFGRSRTERVNYNSLTKEFEGTPRREKTNYHLILLAKNEIGYRNLCYLSTESYSTGYYFKPRIDYDLLRDHHEGIICSSACILGEVSNRLLNHDVDGARRTAQWFQELFGEDYYLEVMNHDLDIELAVMRPIRDLADELGIKTIVTNDCHYTRAEEHKIQKTLMLLGMHKSWSDSDVSGSFFGDDVANQQEINDSDAGNEVDPIFETPPTLFMRDYDQMVEANRVNGGEDGRVERELATTNEIADKCDFEMEIIDQGDTDAFFLPMYPLKTDVRYDEYVSDDYEIPEYIKDAVISKLRELGNEGVSELSDYMTDEQVEALRFLMWLCETNLERLVRPKLEAKGEPLPDSYWIKDPPKGFHITHAHNSPDETWIKGQLAKGLTVDDILQIYRDRLAYETSIVVAKKFVNYFLIVQSYVGYTKSNGAQVGPARGSGAGSLLNYLAGITAVDPMPNDLMFERFLNPERRGYPDIDLDFSSEWRDNHLWPHLREIYGYDNTAGVAAYQYFWGKAAIKAAARVLFDRSRDRAVPPEVRDEGKKISVTLANNLADLIDNKPKLDLNDELDGSNPQLTNLIGTDRRYQQIIDLALILQGRVSGEGQHASAYILSPHKVIDHVPLMVAKDERERSQESGTPVTNYLMQFSGEQVASLGYVKLDLLCVNDLEVIQQALKTVRRVYGATIDIESIPMDSKAAFDLLLEGHNAGIFQFDGSPVAERLIQASHSNSISDWSAINALNRPGPLQMGYDKQFIDGKLHPETIRYFTPAAEKYLDNTYGVTCYQEQLMLLSQDRGIVGFTGGEADNMRKILAHKQKAKIDGIVQLAHERAESNGVDKGIVDEFCDIAVAAGSYSFNKSHAFAYALIAYRGAFIKSLFPECFLASLCTLKPKMKGQDKVPDYLEDARQLGVEIRPPHVNWSQAGFSVPERGVIAFGLGGIKGVAAAAQTIIDEREAHGEFADLTDFCCRVPKSVTKSAISALIDAGALDRLGWSRKAMHDSVDEIIAFRKNWFDEQNKEKDLSGALFGDLFGGDANGVPDVELVPPYDTEYTQRQIMRQEKSMFGMYFTGSPEDYFQLSREIEWRRIERDAESGMSGDAPRPIGLCDIDSVPVGTKVVLLANVANVSQRMAKKSGKPYGTLRLMDWGRREESRFGYSPVRYTARCMAFSRTWERCSRPVEDDVVRIVGKIDQDDEGKWPKEIIADEIEVIPTDAQLIQTGNASELAETQKALAERKRREHDPSDDMYMVPILRFPDEASRDEFLCCPELRNLTTGAHVGPVVATYAGDVESGVTVEIRQTRGMVRLAQRYGAEAYKDRIQTAKDAMEREAMRTS